jgi:hypothetical protein
MDDFGADPLADMGAVQLPPAQKTGRANDLILAMARRQQPFHELVGQFHKMFEEIPNLTLREVDARHMEMFATLLEACEAVGISKMSVPPLKECCGKKRVWKEPADGGLRLGDRIAWILTKLGFKKCEGCVKRQAALNRFRLPWGKDGPG